MKKYPRINNQLKEINIFLRRFSYEELKELVVYIREQIINVEEFMYEGEEGDLT